MVIEGVGKCMPRAHCAVVYTVILHDDQRGVKVECAEKRELKLKWRRASLFESVECDIMIEGVENRMLRASQTVL